MNHKVKVILDRGLKTDINSNIYKQGKIYVFHDKKLKPKNKSKRITYLPAPIKDGKLDIGFVLNKIFELGIMSIFVESGGKLSGSFLPYADKIYQFIAPKILNDNSGKSCFDGEKADRIFKCHNFEIESTKLFDKDLLITYKSPKLL